jgi:small subunit ribosomal protein S6
VPAMVERYLAVVTKHNGLTHRNEDSGRRPLAYPINNVHKAHYYLLNIECNNEALEELKNLFKFNDAIIRNLIINRKNAITEVSVMKSKKEEPVE